MSTIKKMTWLMVTIMAIMALPYIGGYIYCQGVFPDHYFQYPPLSAPEKAPFNMTVAIVFAVINITWIILYLFPSLIGFKKYTDPKPAESKQKLKLPIWFWIGMVMWAGTLVVMWGHFSGPKLLLNWADLPLFWGFTLVLDGLVYVRNNGNSIIAKYPQEIVGIGVASISGWLLFEYLNFFVDDNWFYPFGNLIPDNEFTLYAVLGSAGLFPMAFEWYHLLRTFKFFKFRFSNGPKLDLPSWFKTGVLIGCLLSLFFIAMYPEILFGFLWVSPLLIVAIVLGKLGIWTPFVPIKNGNWTPLLISATTYLIQGLLCECWNYFSGTHDAAGVLIETFNPNYWVYSLPYVNVWHVFEMPLLGVQGYLPFGTYCLVWWITFAYLLNIPTRLFNDEATEV
ncbi:MAG: hypothetical protein ACKVQB_10820 [Bacteroidia bacterium]